jgi:TolB-like protein
MAQRVMDCGDGGHILLSHHVAEDLAEYERWRPFLHDLGTFEVKHGVRVGVVNFYSDEIGNAQLPNKFQVLQKHSIRVRWAALATAVLLVAAIIAAFVIISRKAAISPSIIPEKSIAVLPFANLSEEKANAYFADGIQDEILTRISKIADLKVISRTSTQHYKSAPENLPEIARQLDVAHILEGSVQKSGDAVRVNVQSRQLMIPIFGPIPLIVDSPTSFRLRVTSQKPSPINCERNSPVVKSRSSRPGRRTIPRPMMPICAGWLTH